MKSVELVAIQYAEELYRSYLPPRLNLGEERARYSFEMPEIVEHQLFLLLARPILLGCRFASPFGLNQILPTVV